MRIAVLSGKGGAGKTTLSLNLALVLKNAALVDCDAEEPNLHLYLEPVQPVSSKVSVRYPEIDNEKCTHCGECARFCRFHALLISKKAAVVMPELCHDCGGCRLVCPAGAIRWRERAIGAVRRWHPTDRSPLEIFEARLNVGELSGVRIIEEALEEASAHQNMIIDAPPGTACSTVAAVEGADYALLAAEPTPFGLSDMAMAVEMLEKMKIPCGVVITKGGMADERPLRLWCSEKTIPVLGAIPFSREAAAWSAEGQLLAEKSPVYLKAYTEAALNLMKAVSSTAEATE